jgi:hypothetical protein
MDIQRGGSFNVVFDGIRAEHDGRQLIIQSFEKCDLADCNRIVARLEGLILKRVSYAEILSQDRDWFLSYLSNITATRTEYVPLRNVTDLPDPLKAEFSAMEWHFVRNSVLREDESSYAREIQESGRPTVLRRPLPESNTRNEDLKGWFTALRKSFDEADLRNRLVLCAVALREFKLKHDYYPANLGELKLNPVVTTDPYTGKSIIYKPRGKDYLLYGVGEDGRDDGGIPVNEATTSRVGDLGILPFRYYDQSGSTQPVTYRRVPHMLPPVLPKGAPPLKQ